MSQGLLMRALKGETLPVPPVWLMRQAGRYLPEYRAVRERAGGFLNLCFDPDLASEVTLQPVRRFGFDAAILFADILLIPYALGQPLRFETGEGPKLDPITDAASLARLKPVGAAQRLASVYETVRRVKAALPPGTALIGFAGAPWTVATYMIAGQGTPDQAAAKLLAYRDPSLLEAMSDMLIEATCDYLSAQIEAGADVIQIFDTWAGGLAMPLFERAVLRPTREIISRLRARHGDVPIIAFPRGIGSSIAAYVEATRPTAISLATGEDLDAVAAALPEDMPLQGNLDPLALLAGGAALEDGTRRILSLARQRPFIFNLGHGILPSTPPEHVGQLLSLVRAQDPTA